jgi:gas vesicle protein
MSMADALIGVVLGGLISVTTTLAIDQVRSRRELRHRWDAAGLEAIAHFIEEVNKAIGNLYDEGRSRFVNGPDAEITANFDRQSRAAMDSVRVAHARARLLMSPVGDSLARYYQALDGLKKLADIGFAGDDARWKDAQTKLRAEMDALLSDAATALHIRSQ